MRSMVGLQNGQLGALDDGKGKRTGDIRFSETTEPQISFVEFLIEEMQMTIRRSVLPSLVAFFFLPVVPVCESQASKRADHAAAARTSRPAGGEADDLAAKIGFRFDILDVVTDHQFKGQKNSFHVEYEYAGLLQGAGFDPKGHAVPATTYPYFQSVRDTIMGYIARYPEKEDFYELFGMN